MAIDRQGGSGAEVEVPPGMLSYLSGRAAASLITLGLFVTGVFVLVEALIPYDYRGSTEPAAPLGDRYLGYMQGLFRGDLGESYGGIPVASLILDALPGTLLIFATGGILAYLLGSWLGRVAAWRLGVVGGSVATAVGLVFYTLFPPLLIFLLIHFGREPLLSARTALGLPTDSLVLFRDSPIDETDLIGLGGRALLVALVLALALRGFARRRGWRLVPAFVLPATLLGMMLAVSRLGIGPQALDVFLFRSTRDVEIGAGSPVLAVVAFLLLAFGEVMFLWRAGITDERSEDYVLTARGKGVPEDEIRDRHVARNVALPILSRSFAALPFLLTGLIIIEYQVQIGSCALYEDGNEFGRCVYWSGGLSTTLFTAVREVDIPVILGVLVAIGVLLLLLRLIAEIAHAALDPRVRFRGQR
ncbi:MAG: hypothetical protein ACT4OP_06825 [Actinomycetota bacterium]